MRVPPAAADEHDLVDVAQARTMARSRRARGLPVHEVYYENQKHGFLQYDHEANVSRWCLSDVLSFLQDGHGTDEAHTRTEAAIAETPPSLDPAP